jgi:drug/metabolite transporter (DMT)-like permease
MTDPKLIPPRVYVVLLAGIAAVSFAAIFVRFALAEGIPTPAIAAGRLTLSALILTPLALRVHGDALKRLTRADLLLAAASGLLLAIHFGTWIASLAYTTVLISVVFVATSPLWVALLEVVFLRVRLAALVVVGLLIAFVGGLVIGVGGESGTAFTGESLTGGLLALAGAVAIAVYLVIGRKLRAKLPLVPYIWLVYGFAAAFLLLLVLITRSPMIGYSAQGYFWIALLALMPQLIGHSSFNFALRYLSATYVSLATQMEPIGSAVAAFFLLNEKPTAPQLVGSAAILIGVVLATLGQTAAASPDAPSD